MNEAPIKKLAKVFKTGEVAKICGVHLRTVIRWIERGELNAYQLPGRGDNRITADNLVLFLKKNDLPLPAELQLTQQRILVVDDDHDMAATLQRFLQRANFETAVAHDGFQAGNKLANFSPSLITLDLKMPGMSGLSVIKYIRLQEQMTNLKILVISALDEPELAHAVEIGADAFIQKPFNNKQLLERIKTLLE